MLKLGGQDIQSFSLFVKMTAIFAGVLFIALGKFEIERERPQIDEPPSISRPPPAPASVRPPPIANKAGAFILETGNIEETGHVIDGDTLVVGSRRIRLHGIDAPEIGQVCMQGKESIDCGKLSAAALRDFVSGHRVACEFAGVDRYQRQIGTCFLRGGIDVNRLMVESGWAIAYRHYSRAYEQAENYARNRRLGLWAGSFVPPAEWRAGVR